MAGEPTTLRFQVWSDLYLNTPAEVNNWNHNRLAEYLLIPGDTSLMLTPAHYGRVRSFLASLCGKFRRVFIIAGDRNWGAESAQVEGGPVPVIGATGALAAFRRLEAEAIMNGRFDVLGAR